MKMKWWWGLWCDANRKCNRNWRDYKIKRSVENKHNIDRTESELWQKTAFIKIECKKMIKMKKSTVNKIGKTEALILGEGLKTNSTLMKLCLIGNMLYSGNTQLIWRRDHILTVNMRKDNILTNRTQTRGRRRFFTCWSIEGEPYIKNADSVEYQLLGQEK